MVTTLSMIIRIHSDNVGKHLKEPMYKVRTQSMLLTTGVRTLQT